MTRRPSSASGRFRPAPRRSLLALWLLVAVAAAACIGDLASPSPESPTDEPTATATASPVDPTDTPPPSDSPAPTDAAEASPTATVEPTASGEPLTVDACSGNDDNRDFYRGLAEAVDWDVYCPVLPDGWSVSDGEYQLDGGGWLDISYRGPGGTLTLREGNDCVAPDDCVPDGAEESGDHAFGDREGTLLVTDTDLFAVVVDRGAAPSWVIIGRDMGVDDLEAYAAALVRVE